MPVLRAPAGLRQKPFLFSQKIEWDTTRLGFPFPHICALLLLPSPPHQNPALLSREPSCSKSPPEELGADVQLNCSDLPPGFPSLCLLIYVQSTSLSTKRGCQEDFHQGCLLSFSVNNYLEGNLCVLVIVLCPRYRERTDTIPGLLEPTF